MSLEDLIRSECEKGKFTHLTLAALPKGKFQAGYRDTGYSAYNVVIDQDPIKALIGVLKNKRDLREPLKKPETESRRRNRDLI